MTDLVAVPSSCVHLVPEEIPDSLACILEPFSIIYGNLVPAIRKEKAKNVVIIGAGQVGMMALFPQKAQAVGEQGIIFRNHKRYRIPILCRTKAWRRPDYRQPYHRSPRSYPGTDRGNRRRHYSGCQRF